jgi:hypothetical protein
MFIDQIRRFAAEVLPALQPYKIARVPLERDPVKLKRIRHWRGNWRIPVR